MDKIVLTTPDELKALIYEVLEDYYRNQKIEKEQEYTDAMTVETAVTFLNQNGFPSSKNRLYRMTSEGRIPYGKHGNRLVFSKRELLLWAEKNTVRHDEMKYLL